MSPRVDVPSWSWLAFAGVVLVSLTVDLWAHRGGRSLSRQRAIGWSVGWVVLSLLFGAGIAARFGWRPAIEFVTAYATEKSLSLDNLFLFIVIFARLGIPEAEQHRVLFWGILAAFATRALFIAAGTAMLAAWHPVVYLLGGLLLYTGIKTAFERPQAAREGRLLPFLRRHLPFTSRLSGHRFLVVEGGQRMGTPLLLALLVVEFTDVLFAVDSIPAALAISREPFIVYSSNVFAVLGLRALYLVIAQALIGLKYLRFGLGGVLAFAGGKMLVGERLHVSHVVSLIVIVTMMTVAIVFSLPARRRSGGGAPAAGDVRS